MIRRPLRIVFAYEGLTQGNLVKAITQNGWEEVFDQVCILSRGVLLRRLGEKADLLTFDGNGLFAFVRGKAAALAFLYYYLVSYGARFQIRALNFSPYIEPLEFWDSRL